MIIIRAFAVFACLAIAVSSRAAEDSPESLGLYVPDGQLYSHPFKVFVEHRVTEEMQPTLLLRPLSKLTGPEREKKSLSPILVAPDQKWVQQEVGGEVARTGTLLVFDLSRQSICHYKAVARLEPVLSWEEPPAEQAAGKVEGTAGAKQVALSKAVVPSSVYVGNLRAALGYTVPTMFILVLLVFRWSHLVMGDWRFLISGPDRYMSLWRTQLLLWTVATGGLVFCFGLMRLDVPEIPESVVALMGLSLATGAAGSVAANRDKARTGVKERAAQNAEKRPKFRELISMFSELAPNQVELSLPKAQMFLWTGVVIVLFITKSLLDGVLWQVPWELVALTGFSQAGYIGDKFITPATTDQNGSRQPPLQPPEKPPTGGGPPGPPTA